MVRLGNQELNPAKPGRAFAHRMIQRLMIAASASSMPAKASGSLILVARIAITAIIVAPESPSLGL